MKLNAALVQENNHGISMVDAWSGPIIRLPFESTGRSILARGRYELSARVLYLKRSCARHIVRAVSYISGLIEMNRVIKHFIRVTFCAESNVRRGPYILSGT